MSKTFRAWKIDEPLLLPPLVQDFVAEDHLARFVLNLVRDEIDLAAIIASYDSDRGQPPFDPVMMTTLLLYSYCCGIYASRRIAKACQERVDFMSIVAFDAPDFRTVSEFRRRHLKALGALFTQILQLCETAGLVKLGDVALDGTKIKANASKHKAMSYERMEKRAAELEAEVASWLAAAEAIDATEDKLYGADKTGEEMPDWVADKKRRAERIRKAKAELEAEAKAAAEAKRKAAVEAQQQREAEGRKKPGRPAAPPADTPEPKAQKNFTDPESRIMKSKDGFVQAYNAQIAVDSQAQIIVAQDVTQSAVDSGQLVPMIDATKTNLGRYPGQASADAGYCSEANLEALETRDIDGYVATGRARDAVAGNVAAEAAAAPGASEPTSTSKPQAEPKPTRVEAMRAKLKAGGHASPYRLRKQLPEPVFGQIKQARGFRQFLLRGFEKICGEWAIVCTAHNLLKLARGRTLSAALPQAA
ncbi:MAG: IS1182 family transposase [Xanthobacteraceae bacterium]